MKDGPAREWNIPGKAEGCATFDIRRDHALIRREFNKRDAAGGQRGGRGGEGTS